MPAEVCGLGGPRPAPAPLPCGQWPGAAHWTRPLSPASSASSPSRGVELTVMSAREEMGAIWEVRVHGAHASLGEKVAPRWLGPGPAARALRLSLYRLTKSRPRCACARRVGPVPALARLPRPSLQCWCPGAAHGCWACQAEAPLRLAQLCQPGPLGPATVHRSPTMPLGAAAAGCVSLPKTPLPGATVGPGLSLTAAGPANSPPQAMQPSSGQDGGSGRRMGRQGQSCLLCVPSRGLGQAVLNRRRGQGA